MERLAFLFVLLTTWSVVITQETPTVSNSTGEYYFFTGSESTSPARTIICGNTAGCFVKCSGELSCGSTTISASGTSNLVLRCLNRYACRTLIISDGPTDTADIQCVSQFGYACGGYNTGDYSTFELRSTPNVNILCDQQVTTDSTDGGSCYGLRVNAQNADTVAVNCMYLEDCYSTKFYVDEVSTSATIIGYGEKSLYQTYISAADANQLSVECNAKSACYSGDIYPPYQSEYAFSIFCISVYDACRAMDIRIPNSQDFTTNFMEMICPRANLNTNGCNFYFYCNDLGTSYKTATAWSSSTSRFICNDQDCCPWTDYDNMVQSTTTVNPLPNAMTPTSSNATAEWYELSAATTYQMISCTKPACFIECTVADACYRASVYAGASDYLKLTCSGTGACEYMYLSEGPSNQADILCTAKLGSGCKGSVLFLSDTSVVNLYCSWDTTSGNCYQMQVWAENAATVDVNCEGSYSCDESVFRLWSVTDRAVISGNYRSLDSAKVYASSANYLEINCNAGYTCQQMDIYPPYASEYAFRLYCAPHTYSCYYVDVKVDWSTQYVDNFMSLLCPRTNTRGGACGIYFYCLDISSSYSTAMSYGTFRDRYYCSDSDCCPWQNQGIYSPYTYAPGTTRQALPNAMDPTSEDSNGEYYKVTASSTDLKEISCGHSVGCYIECMDSEACDSFVIYAGETDYLQLICSGQSSCDDVYITKGPKVAADINCTASLGSACSQAAFILYETDLIVNLFCDSETSNSGACYQAAVWAPYAQEVNVYCLGAYSCDESFMAFDYATVVSIIGDGSHSIDSADIYASKAGRLNMECNGASSCYSADVNAPYNEEYIFRLICGDGTNACDYFDIRVPNTTVMENNFLSLTCPPIDSCTSSYNCYHDCDARFYCWNDASASSGYSYSSLQYSSTTKKFSCSDDDCCPWEDLNYMVAPKECVFDAESGQFCGYSLFVKGFNLWSLELSGNAILDINHLVQNTESWTDEGGSCSLASLEFGSNYESYSDYAEADATDIAGSYSSGANAAGGSLSSARTATKTYAGKEQSYIYTMDVSCATATAALVASNSIYWNTNFVNALRVLPSTYSSSDIDDYIDFWNSYGTHIMKSAQLGGEVRGSIVSSKCNVMQSYGDAESYEVCLNGAYKGVSAAGCTGESSSSSGNNTAALLVTKTQIDVKGGDTATFSTVFQKFKSKSTDFQSWINDLAVSPDVIGGNLDGIHDVILNAINLGGHRLNDDLSSAKTDSEWQNIANALKEAYEERSTQLIAEESFDNTECEILTCKGGTVDTESCQCTGCGDNGCCTLRTDDANAPYCIPFCIFIAVFSALLNY